MGSAAASASGMPVGAAARTSAGTTTCSAAAPSADHRQEADHPLTHLEAASRPSPSASTVPATSMPGVCGSTTGIGPCMPPARMLASTPLNDVAVTRSRTSPGPGSGTATSSSRRTSGSPYSWNRTAFMPTSPRRWWPGSGAVAVPPERPAGPELGGSAPAHLPGHAPANTPSGRFRPLLVAARTASGRGQALAPLGRDAAQEHRALLGGGLLPAGDVRHGLGEHGAEPDDGARVHVRADRPVGVAPLDDRRHGPLHLPRAARPTRSPPSGARRAGAARARPGGRRSGAGTGRRRPGPSRRTARASCASARMRR